MPRLRTTAGRPNSLSSRPRVKGWRDPSDYDVNDGSREDAVPERRPAAAPARRPEEARQPRSVAPVGRFLTAQQIEAVRAVMRLFLTEDERHGVPVDRRLRCQACGRTQWAAGYVLYGRDAFCNDCAADFEISRLRGHGESAAEFLAARADRAAG